MIRKTAVALALAWLVPLATHPLGLDLILPVLVVAGTVAVQRGCVCLVDRLVVACAQLFGAACVFVFLQCAQVSKDPSNPFSLQDSARITLPAR